jgi:adenylyltransferase/sulfurtransferase
MPNYREILQQVKSEIDEVDVTQARDLVAADDRPLIVDVRELDEWTEGRIPGAILIPRGNLESRIEQAAPDHAQPILLYCAAGNRSAFAAKSLEELGYENVVSLAGGYTDWKRSGLPTELPRTLDGAKRQRYSRHVLIPEVGEEGQLKLLDSRVLLLGAGGLGSPAALYLAAAGVGRIGIVDDDRVDASNLQRQVMHSTSRLGEWKGESAKRTLEELNPDVEVVPYLERMTSENVERILADGWDVIVDGADNFPTRYRSTTPPSGTTFRSSTARSTASRARRPCSSPATARVIAASSRSRRRPSSHRAARKAACSASCRASSARCRRARR